MYVLPTVNTLKKKSPFPYPGRGNSGDIHLFWDQGEWEAVNTFFPRFLQFLTFSPDQNTKVISFLNHHTL